MSRFTPTQRMRFYVRSSSLIIMRSKCALEVSEMIMGTMRCTKVETWMNGTSSDSRIIRISML